MMLKLEVVTILILFTTSCLGDVNENCNEDIQHLKTEVNQLKSDIKHLKSVIQLLAPNIDIDDLEEKSIEDDVQQNAEDIVELQMDVIQLDYRITESLPPVGTILAWHAQLSTIKAIPQGWQRCDGSLIETGPLAGKHTPDLNFDGRFLRGGLDFQSGDFEEDAIQDHLHTDKGHTHHDNGHVHKFNKELPPNIDYGDFILRHDGHLDTLVCNDHCVGGAQWGLSFCRETPTGFSNIAPSTSNMGGVEEGRMADETRVKNMKIVWIIRIN